MSSRGRPLGCHHWQVFPRGRFHLASQRRKLQHRSVSVTSGHCTFAGHVRSVASRQGVGSPHCERQTAHHFWRVPRGLVFEGVRGLRAFPRPMPRRHATQTNTHPVTRTSSNQVIGLRVRWVADGVLSVAELPHTCRLWEFFQKNRSHN